MRQIDRYYILYRLHNETDNGTVSFYAAANAPQVKNGNILLVHSPLYYYCVNDDIYLNTYFRCITSSFQKGIQLFMLQQLLLIKVVVLLYQYKMLQLVILVSIHPFICLCLQCPVNDLLENARSKGVYQTMITDASLTVTAVSTHIIMSSYFILIVFFVIFSMKQQKVMTSLLLLLQLMVLSVINVRRWS